MRYAFSYMLSLIVTEKQANDISTFRNLFCIPNITLRIQSRGNVWCNHL